jgi:hypothetical protein
MYVKSLACQEVKDNSKLPWLYVFVGLLFCGQRLLVDVRLKQPERVADVDASATDKRLALVKNSRHSSLIVWDGDSLASSTEGA